MSSMASWQAVRMAVSGSTWDGWYMMASLSHWRAKEYASSAMARVTPLAA
jgi:hypothetical protein